MSDRIPGGFAGLFLAGATAGLLAAPALGTPAGADGPEDGATYAPPSATTRPPAASRSGASACTAAARSPSTGAPARDPDRVELRPTRNARGAEGFVELTFARSPYGVTVSTDGSYTYDVRLRILRMRRDPDVTYVAWAATPDLDRTTKLGVLDEDGSVTGRVDWNKFLVAVTAEESADIDRWRGPVLLTAASPATRMHTMAGHGIFESHTGPC